jgi:transcriptional regulator with XRE-family HTH domain
VDLYKEVGKLISEHRRTFGISQEKLAALSDSHEDYIGKIERGERRPTLEKIFSIISAMNIPISTFFSELEGRLK